MKCYYVTPIRTTYDRDTMVSPIKFGVSRVNILHYSVINFQVNRTYPSRVIVVGSWVRFCVDSLGAADLSVFERSDAPTSQYLEVR